MTRPLLLLCLSLLFFACGGEKGQSDKQPAENDSITSESDKNALDSLKGVYEKIYNSRNDWLPAKSVAEKGKINPVDEALQDTAFFVFRESLIQAIKKKDVFYLLDVVAEDITHSFGDNDGVAGFVQRWQLDSPEGIEHSSIWHELEQVLINGGSFSEGGKRFTAPYYFAEFPDGYDAFTHAAIIGRGVRMRERAGLNTKVVKSLSYDIVEVIEFTDKMERIGDEEFPWVHIKLLDGRQGYLWGKFIGTPIGYRAGFVRQPNGSWNMEFFIAGD